MPISATDHDSSNLGPLVSRSLSDPNLSSTNQSSHLPPSGRSTQSTTSTTTRRKGGRNRPRRKSNAKTTSDYLTEESLEKFNERNAANDMKKNTNSSPNYKGLTDSTLYISRQKHVGFNHGPESLKTTSTSSSISTVFMKIQEWSISCFKGKHDSRINVAASRNSRNSLQQLSKVDSFAMTNTTAIKEALELRRKELSVYKMRNSINEEKPMRERVSIEAVQKEPVVLEKKETVIMVENTEKPEENTKKKDRQFVWANKYRPKALKDFICNRDKAEELIGVVQQGQCSHYIFEGPHGVGKRTMVWALLREAFGPDKLMTKEESKEFSLKVKLFSILDAVELFLFSLVRTTILAYGKSWRMAIDILVLPWQGEALPSIKVNMQISSHHVEINSSELGGYEKQVIMELIKEKHSMAIDQGMQCDHSNCHAIIVHEADRLSTDAQLYIRWLMERNKGCNKIFFCCHDASKLQTIKPLCKVVKLLPPSNMEIADVLEFIAEQEGLQLPRQLAERIAENSKHNLRQAIRSFEASWQLNSPLKEEQVIMTGWEEDIANIAKNIIDEQSPKQLYAIRGKLQSLIEHNVSPEFIFSTLVDELKKILGDEFHARIDTLYQEYNRDYGGFTNSDKPIALLRHGNEGLEGKRKNVHQFLRIEEFTAKFMSCYKTSVANSIDHQIGIRTITAQ
ncbi:hypothetical protein IFM89_032787, partial [Coptis chinensis]